MLFIIILNKQLKCTILPINVLICYETTQQPIFIMADNSEILQAIADLKKEVIDLKSDMQSGFRSVNKRLDGIENELRKIDTVLGYSEQYNNIPT